jgi:PRTRC genetic system protein A
MKYAALIRYLAAARTPLPPVCAALEYVLAGNGVFARGVRRGVSVTIPVVPCTVKGLNPFTPSFALHYALVPAAIMEAMLDMARSARDADGDPAEIVFHVRWAGSTWRLDVPLQTQDSTHVQPLGEAIGSSYAAALIEVHSHHAMPAFFSSTDDADETGFRIFAVLGDIFTQPQIRVRVGLYGHTWTIPAHWVFTLPAGVVDVET